MPRLIFLAVDLGAIWRIGSGRRIHPSSAGLIFRLPGSVEQDYFWAAFSTAENAGFGLPSRSNSSGYEVRPRTGQLFSHDVLSVAPQSVTRFTTPRCFQNTANRSP